LWSQTPTTASVSGTLGRIEIAGPFYRPAVVRVHPHHGEPWEIDRPVENGFQFEIAEAARCIAQGRLQSEVMPWHASREVMAVIDEARRSLGVVYPGE
jgi:predicted dehydrogenase